MTRCFVNMHLQIKIIFINCRWPRKPRGWQKSRRESSIWMHAREKLIGVYFSRNQSISLLERGSRARPTGVNTELFERLNMYFEELVLFMNSQCICCYVLTMICVIRMRRNRPQIKSLHVFPVSIRCQNTGLES